MVHQITVGLLPTLASAQVEKAIKRQFRKKYDEDDVTLSFVPFDVFQTSTSSVDVFVVDSLFLSDLVKQNKVSPLEGSVSSSDFLPHSLEAAQVEGKTYGIPQLVSADYLFYYTDDSAAHSVVNSVKTSSELAQQTTSSLALFYPNVFNSTTLALEYAKIIGLDKNLPTSLDQVNQDAVNVLRKILNNAQISGVNNLIISPSGRNNMNLLVSADRLQNTSLENVNVKALETAGKRSIYVSVAVLSSSIAAEKASIAKDVLQIITSAEIAQVFAQNVQKEYFVPARVSAAEEASKQSSVAKQVVSLLQDASSTQVVRLTESIANIKTAGKLLKQYVQRKAVATMRCLAGDIVEKANSGHPGMPIGMSAVAYVLWKYYINVSPSNPHWIGRDRFLLSNGHGCALIYLLLHLAGFNLTMDDLKSFRQLDSKTPGHPEFGHTPGVDATTGPLGQGIGNSVGMAIAQAHLSARFNDVEGLNPFDHYTYVFHGDGCLMEGVALEAIAQAGHHKLGRLIFFYDDNQITIDGETELAFTEDVTKLFEAYGWGVQTVHDGDSNLLEIRNAIENARKSSDSRPQLIRLKTTIGFASLAQGTEKVHGSPLGEKSLVHLKKVSGIPETEKFYVPEDVYAEFKQISSRGEAKYQKWSQSVKQYQETKGEKGQILASIIEGKLPDFASKLPKYTVNDKPMATRKTSQLTLNAVAPVVTNLMGGSADLTPSNLTWMDCTKDFEPKDRTGRYLRFGVREHSMVSIGNGLALYGAIIPFVSTFLIFGGYALGAIRVGALSHLGLIYIMTHDSIGLGEDGPTHQSIEMLPLLRSIPNLNLIRPADGNETSGAYKIALESRQTPTVLSLSRQDVPQLPNTSFEGVEKGAYVIVPENKDVKLDLILTGSGTEVSLCVEAAAKLQGKLNVRVVSFPSWFLFEKQSQEYRRSVFPSGVPVVSVEAAHVRGWAQYSHSQIGMTTFGASAPYKLAYQKFGITVENIINKGQKVVEHYRSNNLVPHDLVAQL